MQGLWEQDVDLIYDGGSHPVLTGTRFTTAGNGVQWENSAGAAMALLHFQYRYGNDMGLQLQEHARQVIDSLCHLLAMYGGVPASVLGGNMDAFRVKNHTSPYPGGSDTGISYTYLRYNHVASTAWTGLLLLYQANPSEPIDEAANPFATKAMYVPKSKDLSCLPVTPWPAPATPQVPPMLVPAVAPEAWGGAVTQAATAGATLTGTESDVFPDADESQPLGVCCLLNAKVALDCCATRSCCPTGAGTRLDCCTGPVSPYAAARADVVPSWTPQSAMATGTSK